MTASIKYGLFGHSFGLTLANGNEYMDTKLVLALVKPDNLLFNSHETQTPFNNHTLRKSRKSKISCWFTGVDVLERRKNASIL